MDPLPPPENVPPIRIRVKPEVLAKRKRELAEREAALREDGIEAIEAIPPWLLDWLAAPHLSAENLPDGRVYVTVRGVLGREVHALLRRGDVAALRGIAAKLLALLPDPSRELGE